LAWEPALGAFVSSPAEAVGETLAAIVNAHAKAILIRKCSLMRSSEINGVTAAGRIVFEAQKKGRSYWESGK